MPSEADPDPVRTYERTLLDVMGLPRNLVQGSGRDTIDHLFESPELRTLLYKGIEDWGTPLEQKGLGAFGLISLFFIEANSVRAIKLKPSF